VIPGPAARAAVDERPLGIYIHVPFCASRCGYCDFNTYTAGELGSRLLQATFADAAIAELGLAAGLLPASRQPARTVFFGGGTPTMLAPGDLVRILRAARETVGVAPDAEVTVEANPDSVDRAALSALVEGGFTRVSFGMQSVRPHVLSVLERTHRPGRAHDAAVEARRAGFEHVNLDLIYGTPGESDEDWAASLDAALAAGPDHVSAYALTVEPRTRLAAQVRHGRVPEPDDEVLARRYAMADERLSAEGFAWYEISNWALGEGARCRHNLLYWRNDHWWGVGPGAHSHLGGTRWWNVAHPQAYRDRLAAGESPAAGAEMLDAAGRRTEDVLLGLRLADGLAAATVPERAVDRLLSEGLVEAAGVALGRLVLTREGRLVADHAVRTILVELDRDQAGVVAPAALP
jgi:putative oxygen-independent coproporphyrinogen III oxidase